MTLDDWLYSRTLPFWMEHGLDRESGGFHEALDESRRPVTEAGKRALVQARQIAVFAGAAERGLVDGAREATAHGLEFLLSRFAHPDGGWRFRVDRSGAAIDDRRDLYAQAFVLFSLAAGYRLTAGPSLETLARETLDFLDARMRHPEGGYHEALDAAGRPVADARRQNPHMHLFEACLAWHAATGAAPWRAAAASLAALLRERFVVEGSLRELFGDSLRPAAGDHGRLVEPGHHFEWVWLLVRYRAQTGDAAFDDLAEALYGFACRHGIDAAGHAVIAEVDPTGAPRDRRRRVWPQTEAIKAHAIRWRILGDDSARQRLHAQEEALFRDHLDGAPSGAWHEVVGPDGTPLRKDLPASTLYHLALAAEELLETRS